MMNLREMRLVSVPIFIFPVMLAVFLSIVSIYTMAFPDAFSLFYQRAELLAAQKHVESGFQPSGYTLFLTACIKLGGKEAISWGQGMLYICTVSLSFLFLHILGSSGPVKLLGSCAVALHPYLFVNIRRIVDNNLAVPLFLAFCISALCIDRRRPQYGLIALSGFLLALLTAVRANALSLAALPAAIFLFQGRPAIYKGLLMVFIFLLVFSVSLGLITAAGSGSPLFFPGNSIFNFRAGANENTADFLLKHYNAEHSLRLPTASGGDAPSGKDIRPSRSKAGLSYIAAHPWRYIGLSMLKLITLFRPDYRNVKKAASAHLFYIKAAVQTILAIPLFIWLLAVFRRRPLKASPKNMLVLPAVLLYILPFILTNADPKYRLPIDILMILDSIYLFFKI